MKITKLTLLAFYLNSALDTGKYRDITLQEVGDQIEQGTIFEFLQTRLLGDIDLSLYKEKEKKELLEEWQDFYVAVNASRKFGINNNGLCLLVAYLLEGIQRRQDNNPKTSTSRLD